MNTFVGNIVIEKPIQVDGFIKIEKNAHKYKIPMGIYPVIYFEPQSVQIPLVLNDEQPDFLWIDREDIDEWLQFSNGD